MRDARTASPFFCKAMPALINARPAQRGGKDLACTAAFPHRSQTFAPLPLTPWRACNRPWKMQGQTGTLKLINSTAVARCPNRLPSFWGHAGALTNPKGTRCVGFSGRLSGTFGMEPTSCTTPTEAVATETAPEAIPPTERLATSGPSSPN